MLSLLQGGGFGPCGRDLEPASLHAPSPTPRPQQPPGVAEKGTCIQAFVVHEHAPQPSPRLKQVWFDSPVTLVPKYALAASLGLRGVGMW